MDQKTTAISGDPFAPLEIEYNMYHPHKKMPDGLFQEVEEQKVTLVHPAMAFLSEDIQRTRIIDFSPQTALNLLTWLREEEETLRKLASEQRK